MPFLGKFPTQIVDPEVDIDGGAIDGVTIGATTASAATVTTLTSGNITTTGYIAGPSTFTIDPAAVGDNTGTLVVAGNLQVDGTTTTINSTTMTVDDLNITLASGAANAAAADGAGITVDGASATLTYNSTPDAWSFNKNVGIGTASPSYALHTIGSSDGTIAAFGNGQDNANILLQAAANYGSDNSVDSKWSIRWRGRPNAGGHSLAIYDEENSAERMRIDSSGNVGIGTASPATPLHIKGTTAAQIRSEATTGFAGIHNTNSSGNFYHMIDNSTGAGFSSGAYARVMYSDGAYPMAFYTNANERMRIDSSGNVGIGTSSPAYRLDAQVSDNTWAARVLNTRATDGNGLLVRSDSTNDPITLGVYGNSAYRMVVRADGNVGIGTTSPDTLLHISDTSPHIDIGPQGGNRGKIGYHDLDVYIGSTSSTGEIIFKNNIGSTDSPQTSGDTKMVITDTGVGIGTASPYTPLNIRTSNSLGSTFTGSTRGEGVTVEQSSYTADNYVSLIEAPYAANAAPAARIGVKFNGAGSWLTLGTSNNYATGITNATMVINPNGDVTIDGHVTISDGVYIGGTATGNHLDDYEEGTYTPSYTGSSSSGSTTYSVQTGVYTKVGRTVTVWIDMTITAMSGASGVPYISLPFTSGTSYGTDIYGNTRYDMGAFISWQTADNFTGTRRPTGWITNNSGVMAMYGYTTAGVGHLNSWTLNTTGRISGKIIYTAAF